MDFIRFTSLNVVEDKLYNPCYVVGVDHMIPTNSIVDIEESVFHVRNESKDGEAKVIHGVKIYTDAADIFAATISMDEIWRFCGDKAIKDWTEGVF